MNLLVAAWSVNRRPTLDRAETEILGFIEELGYFDESSLATWVAPSGLLSLCCVRHTEAQTPATEYWGWDARGAAAFSGRPIIWSDGFDADGITPLKAGLYRAPATTWAERLDGRYFAIRYAEDDQTLEIVTDRLGAYPVYIGSTSEITWLSNSAELVRRLVDSTSMTISVLANFVASGWSLGGVPVWNGVEKLPRGVIRRYRPSRAAETVELLPPQKVCGFFNRGGDSAAAAGTLSAATGALAAWTDRPATLRLTGGRDSRVVLAAALDAGVQFTAQTQASQDFATRLSDADVIIGSRLANTVGCRHSITPAPPHAEGSARRLRLMSAGMVSLSDRRPRPVPEGDQPLPLYLNGQGGELARCYYGTPGLDDGEAAAGYLYHHMVHRWPAPILNREGEDLVRQWLRRWTHDQVDCGANLDDLLDLFYLLERMANWAGPSLGVAEYAEDIVSPLWSCRFLPHMFALPRSDRASERFHHDVLSCLAPHLLSIPFQGAGFPPSAASGGRLQLLRRIPSDKIRRELCRQQYRAAIRSLKRTEDRASQEGARMAEAVLSQEAHPAWAVLDRRRIERLLRRDPFALDPRSRRNVARLGTVFAVEPPSA